MSRTKPFNPPDDYAELRDIKPFARVRLWDGTYPYLLDQIRRHPRPCSAIQKFSCEPNREGFPHVFEGRMVADKADRSFLRLDNPEHDRLRRMVTKEFTVRRIEQLTPRIEETRRPADHAVLRSCRREPISSSIFRRRCQPRSSLSCSGFPTRTTSSSTRPPGSSSARNRRPPKVRKSLDELFNYLDALISRKEREPQDDIVSRLVAEQLKPGHVDRLTLINIVRLLLSAGHQTTQNMTALGVLTLLQHPDQLALIKRDPELIPGAVEELLRYLQHPPRRRAPRGAGGHRRQRQTGEGG